MKKEYKTISLMRISEKREQQIRDLEEQCKTADGDCFEFYLRTDLNFNRSLRAFHICYEKEELVGAIALFAPSPDEAEVTAIVKPDCRKQGVFTQMMNSVKAELTAFGIDRIIYKISPSSHTAAAVSRHLGLSHEHSEYLMEYDAEASLDDEINASSVAKRHNADCSCEILEATRSDRAELVPITLTFFPMGLEEAGNWFDTVLESEDMRMYKLVRHTSNPRNGSPDTETDLIIGAANISIGEATCCIFGVGVDEQQRGQGYGRELVTKLLSEIASKWPNNAITLEVSSVNKVAFGLYSSLGFKVKTQIDYFV